MIDMEQVIEDMKKRIPEHPVLKEYYDDMIADGISEDEALDIMIAAWLNRCGCNG